MLYRPLAAAVVALALVACGSSDDDAKKTPPKKEGRAETQSIRNTQAVGINGKAIADKVDDALNKNEQHAKEVEKQSEEQTQWERALLAMGCRGPYNSGAAFFR